MLLRASLISFFAFSKSTEVSESFIQITWYFCCFIVFISFLLLLDIEKYFPITLEGLKLPVNNCQYLHKVVPKSLLALNLLLQASSIFKYYPTKLRIYQRIIVIMGKNLMEFER